jgi:phenylacetic acid degradation operon negative regulatory protein
MDQKRNARRRRSSAPAVELGLRPLRARSVIASTLLGTDPPELSVRTLVRTAEAFGIAEGTARVALSRMVTAGELTADDGRYRLSGPLLERHAHLEASRHPPDEAGAAWDGTWRVAVLTGPARPAAERRALRRLLTRQRLAALRDGVWTRPANLAAGPPLPPVADLAWFTARPDAHPRALAARLFDLDGWAARAAGLRAALAEARPVAGRGGADRSGPSMAAAFVLDAAVLRHLQADPLLPSELLPRSWPGRALRTEYERFDAEFRRAWRAWVHAAG